MNRSLIISSALLGFALLPACGQPTHMSYDFGRAYTEAVTAQADLTRPSVASSEYMLEGVEAAEIRMALREVTTDATDPDVEATAQ